MKRILSKYKTFRRNCALFFREDSERIWRGNWALTKHMALLYLLCLIAYDIYVLLSDDLYLCKLIVNAALSVHAVFVLIRLMWRGNPRPAIVGVLIGFFGFEILSLSLSLGLFVMSDHVAFLFPLTLILMTEIYTLPPKYVITGVAGFSMLFLILSSIFKPLEIFQMDVIGVIVADFIGGVGFATLNISKVESFMGRRELTHISQSDSLTGLQNRHAYTVMLDRRKNTTLRDVGAVFLDVNGLKYINDNLGHQKGDEIIKRTADMLAHYFDRGSIYRISGDEFEVITTGVPQAAFDRVIAMVNRDPEMKDNHLASMGVAWYRNCRDLTRLTDEAEKAMYMNKQSFYINNSGKKHINSGIVNKFARQLMDGGLMFFLTPRLRLADGCVCGAEAFVKTPDENGTPVPIENYYRLLEDARLISKLDFYKAERACETLLHWEAEGRGDLTVAMRVSRVTLLEQGSAARLISLFKTRGANLNLLELQIGKTDSDAEWLSLEKCITELSDMGLRVAVISDGASNAFMMNGVCQAIISGDKMTSLTTNVRARNLTGEIIGMCHHMGMSCLARDAETQEQLAILRDLGCDYAQGPAAGALVPAGRFTGK